jgi:hypothetical protein
MSKASNENLKAAKAQADKLGLRGKERHLFLRDYIAQRPSNPHKKARALAYAEAQKRGLWSKCVAFTPKWLRFFAKFFRRFSHKLSDKTAKLYRYNIGRWAKLAYMSRPGTRIYRENVDFERVRRKAQKLRVKNALHRSPSGITLYSIADDLGVSHKAAKRAAVKIFKELEKARRETVLSESQVSIIRPLLESMSVPK